MYLYTAHVFLHIPGSCNVSNSNLMKTTLNNTKLQYIYVSVIS